MEGFKRDSQTVPWDHQKNKCKRERERERDIINVSESACQHTPNAKQHQQQVLDYTILFPDAFDARRMMVNLCHRFKIDYLIIGKHKKGEKRIRYIFVHTHTHTNLFLIDLMIIQHTTYHVKTIPHVHGKLPKQKGPLPNPCLLKTKTTTTKRWPCLPPHIILLPTWIYYLLISVLKGWTMLLKRERERETIYITLCCYE